MRKSVIKQWLFFTLLITGLTLSSSVAESGQVALPNNVIDKIDSRFTEIYISYGDGYASKEEYDMAEKFYSKAVTLEPKNFKARYRLGLVMEMQKNYTEAEKIYKDRKSVV